MYLLERLQKTAPPCSSLREQSRRGRYSQYLLLKGVEAAAIHGVGQDERDQYQPFKSQQKDVFVATDVVGKFRFPGYSTRHQLRHAGGD